MPKFWSDSLALSSRRLKSVMKQARGEVPNDDLYIFFESMQHTYTPTASSQDVIKMIEQVLTEAHEKIGIVKYLVGVKLDSSVFRCA